MLRIAYTDMQTILDSRKEMEDFRASLTEGDKTPVQSNQSTEDTFYCGICGHSPISTYPHNH